MAFIGALPQVPNGTRLSAESPVMSNKRKSELWIAPQHSLKGPSGDRAWEDRRGGTPSNNRYLELADIALGLKKPAQKHRAGATHVMVKKEPYSR